MEIAEAYTTFRRSLYGYIYSRINHKEDAEDILQNVFIKMQTSFDTLKDKEKMQNWLYRITRNTIIDYYRQRASRKTGFELKDEIALGLADDETPDHTKGLDKCLLGFIAQLPDEYRRIINDSEIKGVSQKELAEKYNMAYPTLRSRVQRGRERLHKMLLNCCTIESDRLGNILEAKQINPCGQISECCD